MTELCPKKCCHNLEENRRFDLFKTISKLSGTLLIQNCKDPRVFFNLMQHRGDLCNITSSDAVGQLRISPAVLFICSQPVTIFYTLYKH